MKSEKKSRPSPDALHLDGADGRRCRPSVSLGHQLSKAVPLVGEDAVIPGAALTATATILELHQRAAVAAAVAPPHAFLDVYAVHGKGERQPVGHLGHAASGSSPYHLVGGVHRSVVVLDGAVEVAGVENALGFK